MSRRDRLCSWLRPALELLGCARLSRPGLNGLDRKLERFLPERDGWFVEAGANDGFRQSNTYYLARFKGWRGVLIEPVPELAQACTRRRREARVYCCALGPPEAAGTTVRLRYSGLMTHVCGAIGDTETEARRALAGLSQQGLPAEQRLFDAPVRTLTDVLKDSGTPADFDLLSLDVEGHEVEVLKGLDLRRFRPRFICIEIRHSHEAAVADCLSPWYRKVETLHQGTAHSDSLWARLDEARPS